MFNILYKSTLLLLALAYFFLFRFESPILDTLANYASALIFVIGIFIIGFWMEKIGPKSLGNSLKLIYQFWITLVGWFLLVPILFFRNNSSVFVEGMYSDYRFLIFSIIPFFFVTNEANGYYKKIFHVVGVVAIASGIFSFITVDKTVADATDRQTVGLPYFMWWVVVCAYPYLFLRSFINRKEFLGILLFAIHIILSLLFLKRAGITSAFVYFFLIFIFSKIGSVNKIKIFSFIVSIFLIISILFGKYLDPLYERFEKDANDIENFDRLTELDEFIDGVTTFQVITGFGANNYFKMYYIGEFDNDVRALHIGIYNVIYKGGILYLLFTIFLMYHIFKLKPFIYEDPEILIGFIMGIYFVISYTFENSWSYVPYHFFKLLPIYRAIYLKDMLSKRAN
jgi:hypothetical protein